MRNVRIIWMLLLGISMLAVAAYAGTNGPSPIPAAPNFQISTNVISLCKGMINNVPVTIKTPPGAAVMQDVQLSLSKTTSAYTVGNGTVSAINVTANIPKTVPLLVFVSLNASPLISTGIGINYQYLTLYSDSEVRNISFGTETCPSTLSVAVSPRILTSGKIQNVTLNFTNTGRLPLNYLSIKSSMPSIDGTFLEVQPVQIRAIAPGNTTQITESVFVYNNATQSFPINISVSMYNGTSLEQLAINPIVLSSGIINITPSSTTLSPTLPSAGSVFSISFVLTNIGTAKASAVTATPVAPGGFSSYGASSVFVGDMQVDSQTPVTVTLTSNKSVKAGNYIVPIRINYLNSLRENLSTTIDVPVDIASFEAFNSLNGQAGQQVRTRSGSGGLLLLILIIVAVVFIVLFYMERKRHNALKEEHRRLKTLNTGKRQ